MGDKITGNKIRTLIGTKTKILFASELLLLFIVMAAALLSKNSVLYSWDSVDKVEPVLVSRGTYSVLVRYDYAGEILNPGSVDMQVVGSRYKGVFANAIPIYAGTTENSLDFTVAASKAVVKVVFEAEDGLEFSEIKVVRTRAGYLKFLCIVLFFSFLADLLVLIWGYHQKYTLSASARLIGIAVPGAALLASLPALTDYTIVGPDILFHMLRIEALRNAILNGELHVRMQSLWLAGHGYANSFFYGDTLLYFPAFLRVAGFTPDFAYRAFLIMVNFLTAWIAYYSFSRMFRNVRIGVFASILYTLAPYRIYNCYNRSAVGEFAAMTFLPLLVYGFYRIYRSDTEEGRDRYAFVIPVIGFSGIIQSHMLSCEMAGLFTVIFCLLLWKKTFSGKIFRQLCLVVIVTILINLWYIVPCLDLMASDSYYFGHNTNVLIQNRGVYPWQIFYTLQAAGSSSRYSETGFVDAEPIGMGIALLAGVLVLILLFAEHQWEQRERILKKAGITVLILLGLALFMSTCLFPWDFLSKHGLNALVGPIQFPTRFTGMVSIFALTAGCIAMAIWQKKEMLGIIAALSVLFAMYQTNDILQTAEEQLRIYNGNGMGTTAILGSEYLPEGASVEHMRWHMPAASSGVTYEAYEKKGLQAEAFVYADAGGYIEFPMLYYKGYTAYAPESGVKYEVEPGAEYDVRVRLPEGFEGRLCVGYAGMWYWHLAEAVSVVSGVALAVLYIYFKKNKNS